MTLGLHKRPHSPGALLACALALVLAVGTPWTVAAANAAGTSPAATPSAMEEANKLYRAENWSGASVAYESIVKKDPKNARAWYRLGVSYHRQGAYKKAVAAYRHAEALQPNPIVMVNLACSFALSESPDSAFAWLDRAVSAGYRQVLAIQSDPDLAPLRADARFGDLVDRLRRAATPCSYAPEARQFDFWVGAWDVRNAQGDLAGTNDIRLGAGDCVLIENWKSSGGGTGQSMNFYDTEAKLWRQIWVDADAEVTRFEGSFTEGQMRFRGERVSKDGRRVPVKMTFTPLQDGRVRQMGETSVDGGKSWTVEYDLYYAPSRRDG